MKSTASPSETLILAAPFGYIEIQADEHRILGISLEPTQATSTSPATALLIEAARQINAYLTDPKFQFTLPLASIGTAFQQKVWQAMAKIPPGAAQSYGALAIVLGTQPRPVAAACKANQYPLIIPCHRVVASQGIGGFCGAQAGPYLDIKRWLLRHEGYPSP